MNAITWLICYAAASVLVLVTGFACGLLWVVSRIRVDGPKAPGDPATERYTTPQRRH